MVRSDQQRQDDMMIVCGVLTFFSLIIVSMRVVIRGFLLRKMGVDDWFSVGAMILTLGYYTCLIVMKYNNVGFPITTLTIPEMVNMLKATLSIQVIYYTIIFCIKSSILFMYLRFAVTRTLRVLCFGTIVLHAIFWVICISTTLAQCTPIDKMWDLQKPQDDESCKVNTTAFFYFTSGFNIITDIWIIALPIKTLYTINRPQKEKYALLAIFGVGVFACVTSIVRLHSIYTYTLAEDPFKNALKVNIWSMIEVNVAILCASVPALKPLFTPHKLREAMGSAKKGSGGGYQYHSYDPSSKKSTETPRSFGDSHYTSSKREGSAGSMKGYDLENIPAVPAVPSTAAGRGIHVEHSVSVESRNGLGSQGGVVRPSKSADGEASSTENILIERPSQ